LDVSIFVKKKIIIINQYIVKNIRKNNYLHNYQKNN
jgi:hypothetical protein